MPSLVAKNGPLAGQRLDVEDELTFGRLDADVVVEDAELSRKHAVFRIVDGKLEVEDLGSTNGTFVEGRRIDEPTRIENGTRVKIGISLFVAEVEPVVQTTRVREIPDARRDAPARDAAGAGRDRAPARHRDHSGAGGSRSEPGARGSGARCSRRRGTGRSHSRRRDPGCRSARRVLPPSSRRGGLATRSWVPVALSYGSAIAAAAGLVVYFATR